MVLVKQSQEIQTAFGYGVAGAGFLLIRKGGANPHNVERFTRQISRVVPGTCSASSNTAIALPKAA